MDDDPLVRNVLEKYFSGCADIQVVGKAANGEDALRLLQSEQVDLVLSDIYMPTMDGLALLRRVSELKTPTVFLAITALETDAAILEILEHGGRGFILKSQPRDEIILSVRHAVAGGTVVSPAAMTRILPYIRRSESDRSSDSATEVVARPEATKTEAKVLALLCQGMSNAEIAANLNYSESTVKKHVSNLLTIYGVSSRLDLVVTVLTR